MNQRSSQSGFSLIELLVSMTIFTVVVTIAAGTLLVLIDANNKAQSTQVVMSNISFAIDSMTREIRTGYNYQCDSTQASVAAESVTADCVEGGTFFSFIEAGDSLTAGLSSKRVSYFYSADEYGEGHGAILRRVGNGSWLPLTTPEVRIQDMQFIVRDSDRTTDVLQPTVTIHMQGEAGEVTGLDTSFALQTTVTQRILDI